MVHMKPHWKTQKTKTPHKSVYQIEHKNVIQDRDSFDPCFANARGLTPHDAGIDLQIPERVIIDRQWNLLFLWCLQQKKNEETELQMCKRQFGKNKSLACNL